MHRLSQKCPQLQSIPPSCQCTQLRQPPFSGDELKQWVDFPDAAEIETNKYKKSEHVREISKIQKKNCILPSVKTDGLAKLMKIILNDWRRYCQAWRQRLHENGRTTSAADHFLNKILDKKNKILDKN